MSTNDLHDRDGLRPGDAPGDVDGEGDPLGDLAGQILALTSRVEQDQARRAEFEDDLRRLRSDLLRNRLRRDTDTLSRERIALDAVRREIADLGAVSAELRRLVDDERAALHSSLEEDRKSHLRAIDEERRQAAEEIARGRQQALEQTREEIARAREAVEAEIAAERDRSRREAEAIRAELEASRVEHARIAAGLDARQVEIDDLHDALQADRLRFEAKVARAAGDRLDDLQAKLESAKNAVDRLARERAELEAKLVAREEVDRRFEGKTPEEILARLRQFEQDKERLEDELRARPRPEAIRDYQAVAVERDRLSDENDQLRFSARKLEAELRAATTSVAEIEAVRQHKEHAETHLKLLQARHDQLRKDVEQFQKLTETSPEREARIGVVEEMIHRDLDRLPTHPAVDEVAWLDLIEKGFEDSRFVFPRRLLNAFHTSVKIADWSSLTVLAGVSGTGKSELPRLYSRFGGLVFEPVAVQPNWDSPQDLFGFFNYMDNKFNARPLLQAIAQSQREPGQDGGFNDRLLLVLLDEMNLARVELYFSELLSKLELRRGQRGGVAIEVDLGSGLAKHRIPLGRNLLFVGTMNEDETTHALSDKALDRSNVITFPVPRKLSSRDELVLAPGNGLLPRSVWDSWQGKPDSLDRAAREEFRAAVEKLNSGLARVGRALGHRVWQSIENYLANHPEVRRAIRDNDTDRLERGLKVAFEDQVVQKIMPKLRGIETEGQAGRACLDVVLEVLHEKAPGLADDFQEARDFGQGSFLWRSAHYLEREG